MSRSGVPPRANSLGKVGGDDVVIPATMLEWTESDGVKLVVFGMDISGLLK